jgi:hypothetical protein
MKYGEISQLRHIMHWLHNYIETNNLVGNATNTIPKAHLDHYEQTLRADPFTPPETDTIQQLITELNGMLNEYHDTKSLENIQQAWTAIRPQLTSILHEKHVLPEILYPRIIIEQTPFDTMH